MRALVIFLVVLNIGFAVWQIATPHQHPLAARLAPADPGVEPLRLLSEATAPPPAAASPGAAPAAASQPAAANLTPAVCYAVGPFTDRQQAEQTAQRMRQKGIASQQRATETRAGDSYRVVLPPLPSKESASQVAQQLAAKGVTDYQVIEDGSQRVVISLGVYKDQQAANRRQAQVDALGYATRIEPREIVTQVFWLDTQASDVPADAWIALLADEPQAQRQPRACP